ncbi:MAG: hypothetical protein IJA35_00705 [Clostridia bacterium]|nr:hypothetical protein [Oscillospiraceae bacterium]MBQ3551669.1 hypothetical protein [Clostridia bacterium]
METTKLIERMRATAKQYETPPYGREVDGTVELLREAADKLETSKAPTATRSIDNVKTLLDALSKGECKGIKSGITYKIAQFARKKGLI